VPQNNPIFFPFCSQPTPFPSPPANCGPTSPLHPCSVGDVRRLWWSKDGVTTSRFSISPTKEFSNLLQIARGHFEPARKEFQPQFDGALVRPQKSWDLFPQLQAFFSVRLHRDADGPGFLVPKRSPQDKKETSPAPSPEPIDFALEHLASKRF